MVRPSFRLGILGGTFNPVHLGHLWAAEEATELLNLTRVVFIPAGRPPHKGLSPIVPFNHRLAMTRLATADRSGFFVSDVEGLRAAPSYTVETLKHFQAEAGPEVELFFLTGLDAFLEVESWKDCPRLFGLASFVVIPRPGSDPQGLEQVLSRAARAKYVWNRDRNAYVAPGLKSVYFWPATGLDVSSTDIRARLAAGRSVRYLVPEPARKYILANGLYGTTASANKGVLD